MKDIEAASQQAALEKERIAMERAKALEEKQG